MNYSKLPDALAEALGRVVVNARKDIDATVGDLRADYDSVKAKLNESYAQTESRIAERLATLKDGADGKDGEPGAPGERGDPGSLLLPPDLVEQVASAIRLLHESPPLVQRGADVPRQFSAPRVARIERDDDGNLVPVYEQQT